MEIARRDDKDEKIDKIRNAAESLFNRFGYKKTTIDDIAREAEIGKGTVYLYFRTKEEIFVDWQRQNAKELLQKLRKAVRSEASPTKQLFKYLTTHLNLIHDFISRGPFLGEMITEFHNQAHSNNYLKEHIIEETSIIRGILEAGIDLKEFDIKNIDETIWLIMVFSQGNVGYSMIQEDYYKAETKINFFVKTLIEGIKKRK